MPTILRNDGGMLVAYVDESGNTGPVARGGALTFTLGCVLVDVDSWPDAFDAMLNLRRRLRSAYGVTMRSEIKANYLMRSTGDVRRFNLAPAQRRLVYRAHLQTVSALPGRHSRSWSTNARTSGIRGSASTSHGRGYFSGSSERVITSKFSSCSSTTRVLTMPYDGGSVARVDT